jgi:hypothetical protein
MQGRRRFLGTLSAGMAASLVPAGVISAAGIASLRDRFAGLVDDSFDLVDSAGTLKKARLVAMDDGPDCPNRPDLEQFSIVFEGSGLNDGLYKVYHPSTGRLQIGLMSSGEAGSTVRRQRAHFSNFV